MGGPVALELREGCGVFGIYSHSEAANMTYLGLHALQHRGQESAGIATADGQRIMTHRGMGLVADIFDEDTLAKLHGHHAIGHVRYSTAGSSDLKNAQPLLVTSSKGAVALAHNGNLVNYEIIRNELENHGAIFQSSTDTEVIAHLMAISQQEKLIDRIISALSYVRGAFSLVFLTEKALIAARDPQGFRPLVLGTLGDSYVVASETCAFDLIGAKFEREIEPGEIIVVDEWGLNSLKPFTQQQHAKCVFEFVYFARPDSTIFGRNVYEVRKELGRQLAREAPVPADLVMAVPDSGVPAAIGFAEESGIPYEIGMIRNHYVGRTFIEPQQSIRNFGVKLKLNPIPHVLKGKRVIVVDDSIVRGTTGRKIMKMLRHAGAREVHARITSPPFAWPCYYGIDTPTRKELIAAVHTIEEMNQFLTSDSLRYLSLDGLLKIAAKNDIEGFCRACFSGQYPVKIPQPSTVEQIPLFRGHAKTNGESPGAREEKPPVPAETPVAKEKGTRTDFVY
ncbi:MAG: amidophosphoribosyltransferase [Nitrospirae bacterium]|nr:amidophosphoribosyltransferase [Nitrospirota bacterium]